MVIEKKSILVMAFNTEIENIFQKKHSDNIIDILKELVKSVICQGFSKTSFLVCDHIKYIKKIQFANDPEMYIFYTAKKLFPNDEAYLEKVEKVHAKYEGKVLSNFKELYGLYYRLSKERPPRKEKVTVVEAENLLAELLI